MGTRHIVCTSAASGEGKEGSGKIAGTLQDAGALSPDSSCRGPRFRARYLPLTLAAGRGGFRGQGRVSVFQPRMDAHPEPWGQTMLFAVKGVDPQCEGNRCQRVASRGHGWLCGVRAGFRFSSHEWMSTQGLGVRPCCAPRKVLIFSARAIGVSSTFPLNVPGMMN